MTTETKPAKGSQAWLDELTSTPYEITEQLIGTNYHKIGRLYDWSLNYEPGRNPWCVLLDLIGWSEENLGATLVQNPAEIIGYTEAGMLGEALTLYADEPHAVRAIVEALTRAEAGE